MDVSKFSLTGFSSSNRVKAPWIQMLIEPVKFHSKLPKMLYQTWMIQR